MCARLEGAHLRCWIAPRDIAPGEEWAAAIPKAIHTARVMVVVFSHNTNLSRQISREVEIAVDSGLVIIPLRIDDVAPEGSFEYYLSTEHWLDALTPPLEAHLDRLAASVLRILSPDEIHAGPSASLATAPVQATVQQPPSPPVPPWGPPTAPPQPPLAAAPPRAPLSATPSHMVWAIICIFLFWPTAIPAIIYASRVNTTVASGDAAAASIASKLAQRYCWISTAVGAVIYFIVIVVAATARPTVG